MIRDSLTPRATSTRTVENVVRIVVYAFERKLLAKARKISMQRVSFGASMGGTSTRRIWWHCAAEVRTDCKCGMRFLRTFRKCNAHVLTTKAVASFEARHRSELLRRHEVPEFENNAKLLQKSWLREHWPQSIFFHTSERELRYSPETIPNDLVGWLIKHQMRSEDQTAFRLLHGIKKKSLSTSSPLPSVLNI